jgi:outer membrane receptor protein involved in Fe transport
MVAEPDPNGVSFSTLQDFLQNNPTKFNGGVIISVRPRNFRQSIYGAYVQDDWRVLSNLNLGLRYEMATIPAETHGLMVNLRNITECYAHLRNT